MKPTNYTPFSFGMSFLTRYYGRSLTRIIIEEAKPVAEHMDRELDRFGEELVTQAFSSDANKYDYTVTYENWITVVPSSDCVITGFSNPVENEKCECGSGNDLMGPGHSSWCKRYSNS